MSLIYEQVSMWFWNDSSDACVRRVVCDPDRKEAPYASLSSSSNQDNNWVGFVSTPLCQYKMGSDENRRKKTAPNETLTPNDPLPKIMIIDLSEFPVRRSVGFGGLLFSHHKCISLIKRGNVSFSAIWLF